MEYRQAVWSDLDELKLMFSAIVKNMDAQGIVIWDEVYPNDCFAEDIEKQRLYVLVQAGEIVAAFALCASNPGADAVEWCDRQAKALYLERLGVRVRCSGNGLAGLMLKKAIETAAALGAQYLRLFVVDINLPAIRLYEKMAFRRVPGIYDEVMDENFVLHEFGYEIELR